MKKIVVGGIAALVLSIPTAVLADEAQVIALYQQLISLLQQQITALQAKALTIEPNTGTAPLQVIFTVNNSQGNEAIDFGDGRSTGSAGCVTNSRGFCDLSKPLIHVYQYPGNYKVSLYRTFGNEAMVIATYVVAVK